MVKNLPVILKSRVDLWVGKIHWRREWKPSPVLMPGESHGQKTLAGYSLWGHKRLDTTEQLTLLVYKLHDFGCPVL